VGKGDKSNFGGPSLRKWQPPCAEIGLIPVPGRRFQQAHAKTHRPPTAARKATRRTVDQLMAAWHQRTGRTRAEEDIGGQRG